MNARLRPLVLLPLLAGCGDGSPAIRGSIARSGDGCGDPAVTRVYVEGGGDTATVRRCRFQVTAPDSGVLVMAFEDADGERSRMYLSGVPAEGVRLEEVWLADGIAYPSGLDGGGDRVLEVNGLRMAAAGALPREMSSDGVVLDAAADEGAILVRPVNDSLPDLRVRVDSTTEVVTTAGEPASLARLGFGDAVEVEGPVREGMVLAQRLVVPAPPERRLEERGRSSVIEELERMLDALGISIVGNGERAR